MEDSKKSTFRAGAFVYVEGDEDSDEIFIVESGEIGLSSNNKNIKKYKDIVKTGEVFGFTSSLCKRPRMESAIAQRDSVIITLKRDKFIQLLLDNPKVAIKIINYFADELRAYNDMMFTLDHAETDLFSDEIKLFHLGEYYLNSNQYPHARHIFNRYLDQHPHGINAESARKHLNHIAAVGGRFAQEPEKNGIYRTFSDKQIIFAEFEKGDELYIIKEGRVKISKNRNDEEILLSVIRDGDIFGELAIVSNKPRNATATSWGTTTLIAIEKDTLFSVLEKTPAIINKIFMAISQRIWFTYIRLESRVYTRPITRIYAFLENKLLEDRISLKSTNPVTLNFGIDELIRMTGVSASSPGAPMDLLLDDSNLSFNFGQIVIDNPSVLSTKARFYRSRDHIAVSGDEEQAAHREHRYAPPPAEQAPHSKTSAEPAEIASPAPVEATPADDDEGLAIPSQDIPFDFD